MPDITMCGGTNCPLKFNCYNYTATPKPQRQSYFMVVPFNKEEDKCEHFTDNKE